MKHISNGLLVLFACLASVAWAQQQSVGPHAGKHGLPHHRAVGLLPRSFTTTNPIISTQPAADPELKTWDLGHHPDGTWAEPRGINDFGFVVGVGDVLGGYTRQIAVPLFGPKAGQWIDFGTFGGENITSWLAEGGDVSDTAMIVGSAAIEDGRTHAFAWTPWVGEKVDLGALPGDRGSIAIAVNKLGTLIVGVSYNPLGASAVVWTPTVVWKQGRPTTTWTIQKLPTAGLEQPGKVFEGVTLNWWGGWSVNDFGQIAGDAWSDNYDEIALIWNPLPGGKGWKVIQLPHQSRAPGAPSYRYTEALGINERGEIVGDVWEGDTAMTALWRKGSPHGKTWNLTVLPTLSGLPQGWNMAWGINDRGDIVGVSNDADWNWFAARWSTKDANFIQGLGFPGAWSVAFKVNNSRIAVGGYGSDTIQEDVIAVHIH